MIVIEVTLLLCTTSHGTELPSSFCFHFSVFGNSLRGLLCLEIKDGFLENNLGYDKLTGPRFIFTVFGKKDKNKNSIVLWFETLCLGFAFTTPYFYLEGGYMYIFSVYILFF